MSSDSDDESQPVPLPQGQLNSPYPSCPVPLGSPSRHFGQLFAPQASSSAPDLSLSATADDLSSNPIAMPIPMPASGHGWNRAKQTYRSHFKRRYMVETAWRTGGRVQSRQITPDQGVVTSLHLTDKYIVVALDNAKIHIFDANGSHQKTLHGHMMGVWAMVPWGDILVSGGCDRDVRVWNMATGLVIQQELGEGKADRPTDRAYTLCADTARLCVV